MLGYVSALTGCCIWLIVATILNLPVSGTHSIVGATIGMAIVSKGFMVIKWLEILKIGNLLSIYGTYTFCMRFKDISIFN